MKPAVFLDRDGTLIEDAGYISDPEGVRLAPGAAEAVRRFSSAGYLVVVASNQSGVARGLFTEAQLARVHGRMEDLLAEGGAKLDGAYYCPYLDGPEAVVEKYRRDSELRKPRAGMLVQAARELGIDLARSWMVGDAARDVEAGRRAGCRTVFLRTNGAAEGPAVKATHVAQSLAEAAELIEEAPMERLARSTTDEGLQPALVPHNGTSDAVVDALGRIHEQLERTQRRERHQDFSVLRLFGALLQMFAGVGALWGVAGLLDERAEVATARLALACFFQLAALTAFVVDRFR